MTIPQGIRKPRVRVILWTVSTALAGLFLSMKGAEPLGDKLRSIALGGLLGAAVGFGFGNTFVPLEKDKGRWIRIGYSAATFGVIGAIVGSANEGFSSVARGAICGIFIGLVVGTAAEIQSALSKEKCGGCKP